MKNKTLMVVFVSMGAWAQAPPAANQTASATGGTAVAPDVTQHESPATFSSRVSLVMVPVVVRDSKGRAIGNLTKEDFQLFDKGKPQIITRFSVEKSGERAASQAAQVKAEAAADGAEESTGKGGIIASHFVAYLFDDEHLDVGDLAQARSAASKHLDKTLVPADRASIVTTSGSAMLDFTDDRAAMHETLNKIMPKMGAAGPGGCPHVTLYQAYAYAMGDQSAFQAAVQDTITCSALTSLGASIAPSLATAAFDAILGKDQSNTVVLLDTLSRLIRRMATLPGERTIVLISPGFLLQTASPGQNAYDNGPSSAGLIDRAIQGKITINTLDARGLYVTIQRWRCDSGRNLGCRDAPIAIFREYRRRGCMGCFG
jgi:VWFA-related protein